VEGALVRRGCCCGHSGRPHAGWAGVYLATHRAGARVAWTRATRPLCQ
jgi:hypothetical protein